MGEADRKETSSRRWESTQHGWRIRRHAHAWHPPTDVCEADDAYLVDVEVAGMKGGEFVIHFERGILIVRGTRPEKHGARAYHQMEIALGEFASEVQIPGRVVEGEIEATYADGFLHVRLPKAKPKSIPIERSE
jgi:HSP20 family protein